MKVWFYYAKAGGGHYAPAKALADEFGKLKSENTEVKLVDMAERASIFFRASLEKGYVFLTQKAPFLYRLLYDWSRNKNFIKLEFWLTDLFIKSSIKARLIADQPSVIVATHFLVSPLRSAMKELKLNIPIVVLVTEPFSAPPIWFYFKDLNYIVFSDSVKKIAIEEGVSPENVHKYHQILNHKVLELNEENSKSLYDKMGLVLERKNILIIGGANGLPGGKRILAELLGLNLEANFIVVCGNNDKMKSELETVVKNFRKKCAILGYVENISELIAISDLVITKAGAGVIWECLLNKKPILITHYIYGQERGTMEYVTQNGLGWYEPSPKAAAEKAKFILEDKDYLLHLDGQHQKLNLRSGNDEIIRFIQRAGASNS